jgi:hypothetical protein
MVNWLLKSNPDQSHSPMPSVPVIDPALESRAIQDTSVPVIDPDLESEPIQDTTNQHAIQIRLRDYLNKYLSVPKTIKPKKDVERKAQSKWESLNKAIEFVAPEYKKKASKDKNFQYPAETIGNLVEFNSLRRQYTLDGTKSPTITAALATAQTSI